METFPLSGLCGHAWSFGCGHSQVRLVRMNPIWGKPVPPQHAPNLGGLVIPDYFDTEPWIGYRSWLVTPSRDGKGATLRSLHLTYEWNVSNTARCERPMSIRPHDEVAPDPRCSCGLYAQLADYTLPEWERLKKGKLSAVGTVKMWGRIIKCKKGYKAQHMLIESPVLLEVSCKWPHCDEPPVVVVPTNWDISGGTGIGISVEARIFCDMHTPTGSWKEAGLGIEVSVVIREAARQLQARYKGLQVLSYVDLEETKWQI